jgi:hypothetical protein
MQCVPRIAGPAEFRRALNRGLVAVAFTAGALRIAGGHAPNDRAPRAADWLADYLIEL